MTDTINIKVDNLPKLHRHQAGISSRKAVFPKWLRKPVPSQGHKKNVIKYIEEGSLHTVCEEARCPNRSECFSKGTATFLLLGDVCTRNCLFCNISQGLTQLPDSMEPKQVCEAVKKMNLKYVVLTSVTRDDLADGGAGHIAKVISTIQNQIPDIKIEVLIPDLKGNKKDLDTILSAKPDVFNHNIETVSSIFKRVRSEGDYHQSLNILSYAAKYNKNLPVKSGFMVGLGETKEQVHSLMRDLIEAHVSILTIGQYLQPTKHQVPVAEFITPNNFKQYEIYGKKLGFLKVISGPFVRSSYMASDVFNS